MKIKKRTIVFFVFAVLFFIPVFVDTDSLYRNTSADAVLVSDGQPRPENEGKFVAVPGRLEILEPAKDDVFGFAFASPYLDRYAMTGRMAIVLGVDFLLLAVLSMRKKKNAD